MRPDHLPARRPAARPGFTLVELLVVIIIVAVIAGLAIPAVMRAQNAARNAAIKSEIDQLHMAIMNYKNEYGSFPPALDPVYIQTNAYSSASPVLKHLTRIFPRMSTAPFSAPTPPPAPTPDNAISLWMRGYTDDPINPLGLVQSGNGYVLDPSAKRKRLFDLDQSRLNSTTFRYAPKDKPGSPYIYIPSSQYGLNHFPLTFSGLNGTYLPQTDVAGAFFNPDTFQILCAGRDEKFGTDDDLSNFWPGTRLDYIDSVK